MHEQAFFGVSLGIFLRMRLVFAFLEVDFANGASFGGNRRGKAVTRELLTLSASSR
jgi:hypothetical protein